MSTIVELHVCLIYYTGIPASLYSHSHTIDSTISHQPIATIWGSPRSFYHHVGGSASMIPRSGAAAADWWIWSIRSAFHSFDNGRNIRYLTSVAYLQQESTCCLRTALLLYFIKLASVDSATERSKEQRGAFSVCKRIANPWHPKTTNPHTMVMCDSSKLLLLLLFSYTSWPEAMQYLYTLNTCWENHLQI